MFLVYVLLNNVISDALNTGIFEYDTMKQMLLQSFLKIIELFLWPKIGE